MRYNVGKEDTLRILFSDEKMFDLDGMYNAQNDRIWTVNREEADKRGGVQQTRKFPQKVMVWLGACSKGLTPLIILDEGTMDHRLYIDQILPVALKYGDEGFGDIWTFDRGWYQATYACLNSTMVPDEFSIFHRQRSLAPKLTRS